jgi:hypothetical protein
VLIIGFFRLLDYDQNRFARTSMALLSVYVLHKNGSAIITIAGRLSKIDK